MNPDSQQSVLLPAPAPPSGTVLVNDRVSFQTEGKQRVILVHGMFFSHYSADDPAADDYTAYFQQLLERVNSAVRVRFREVQLSEGEIKLNDCHRNVDCWVENFPESKAVRGWLFWPPNGAGQYTFMAHSVVDENGHLVDLTPLDPNTPL
jgi:hypothetical protein